MGESDLFKPQCIALSNAFPPMKEPREDVTKNMPPVAVLGKRCGEVAGDHPVPGKSFKP
jgi:hypothetical protein